MWRIVCVLVALVLLGAEPVRSQVQGAGTTSQIQLTATTNGASMPAVVGNTNLPDGTKLVINLACPLMYCSVNWSDQKAAVVHHGQFATEPFSQDGAPLTTGKYVISVVLLADQDPAVTLPLIDMGWNRMQTFAFTFEVSVSGKG